MLLEAIAKMTIKPRISANTSTKQLRYTCVRSEETFKV